MLYHRRGGNWRLPFPVKIIETQADNIHIKEREHKTDKFNDEFLETQISSATSAKIQQLTAIVQSFLGLIVGIFIIFTYKETKKTALASICAAMASEKAANIAEQSLTVSERAWIGLESIDFTGLFSAEQKYDVRYVIKNFGRTPAFKIRKVFEWKIEKLPNINITNSEFLKIPDDSPETVMFPNGIAVFHPLVNMPKLTHQQIYNILQGIDTLVIQSRFEYFDSFNNKHVNQDRMYYKIGRGVFGPTTDGNYAD